ncbi:MAG: hypothetical protein WD024_02625 [Bacillota bacterium]
MAGSQKKENGRPPFGARALLSWGFEMAVAALGGLYLGSLFDRGRPTALFAPVGLLLGLLVGLHHAYVLVRSTLRKPK